MKRALKQSRDTVAAAAESLGWKLVEIERRGNDHLAFIISNGKKRRRVFTGATPSCNRAMKNLASDTKKVCRNA